MVPRHGFSEDSFLFRFSVAYVCAAYFSAPLLDASRYAKSEGCPNQQVTPWNVVLKVYLVSSSIL